MVTWSVVNLQRNLATGGVVYVHYSAVATDEGYSEGEYGGVPLTPDSSSPSFIPFENLTQDIVLNWIWSILDKNGIEQSLLAKIQEQKTPTKSEGVPW